MSFSLAFYCILCLIDLASENADASTTHFHKLQTEWGISKFMGLSSFNNPSNGYLVGDACVFGAEI